MRTSPVCFVPALIAVSALLQLGCLDDGTRYNKHLAALQPVQSCDEAVEAARQRLLARMEAQVAANLKGELEWLQYGCTDWGGVPMGSVDAGASMQMDGGVAAVGPPAAEEGPTGHSETNTQVKDVDEADFIENDGANIYVLAHGKFRVVDAWPAADAAEVAAVAIEGTPKRMFVHGDRAVIYSSTGPLAAGGYYGAGECFDCEFTGDGEGLVVSILDLADRQSPVLTRKLRFGGSYLSARRIDDVVHTVVTFPEPVIQGLEYWANVEWPSCEDGIFGQVLAQERLKEAYDRLRERNRALIMAADLDAFLPSATDEQYEGGVLTTTAPLLGDCRGLYVSQAGDGASYLSLVSFEPASAGAPGITTILGRPGAVYSSTESLYLAARHSASEMTQWYFPAEEAIQEATAVHKFRLAQAGVPTTYVGSGVVKGHVLNQFSLDEHQGNVRLATTSWGPDGLYNTVAVMAEAGPALEVIGLLDHLAPREDIRAVRFDGDRAYVVTFEQTDPLFVIDLSDPRAPAVLGELVIPGFSTYLHLIDATHAVSIGYDAGWGIQLQLFDVSDPANPALVHKVPLGSSGSGSEAVADHLAFTYYAPKSLLLLPMTLCEPVEYDYGYGMKVSFSGLLAYRVTAAEGFVKLGELPVIDPAQAGFEPYLSCDTWWGSWASSSSAVKRSVVMDDYIYAITLDLIKVAALSDLAHPVASVYLTD